MENLVSAEDLLAKMRAGTKEVYEIRMREMIFPVRMLSLDERLDIRNRMMAKNNSVGGDAVNLSSLVQKEILKAATTIHKTQQSIPERLLDLMSLDEIIFLYNEYQRVTEEVNPSLDTMSVESFQALVSAIKKNSVGPSDLSIPQLRQVFLAYQDLIQRQDGPTSPTDNSPGGRP